MDDDDIAGTVRSANGAEAGVWVIVETGDLEVTFRKIVVTDDEGRFLVPDLPEARYVVWARGYGLLDSAEQTASPGDAVTIDAEVAESPKQAAQVYPANYWLSLLSVPAEDEFPGTGAEGNGIGLRTLWGDEMHSQAVWVDRLKDGCQMCHQMGNLATREIANPDDYESTRHGWDERVKLPNGGWMNGEMEGLGRQRALDIFADWTDRIVAGETPAPPPRPDGVEQNVVVTQWGWSSPGTFIHDNVTTDKRNPTLYGNGELFGVAQVTGKIVINDPLKHTSRELAIPMRTAAGPNTSYGGGMGPNVHNPMMDGKNRVWMTSSIRRPANPDWCKDSDHPSAKNYPIPESGRQLSYFDVETEEFVLIDTCFGTHHLQFSDDENDTLWLSGDTNVVGWLNTKMFDETHDERASQGWCPTILDTNGDGKIGEYVEPGQPVDPTKDKRTSGFAYGIIPNPADGSVWFARRFPVPGEIVRVDPKTCVTEMYQPPFGTDAVPPSQWGHGPRGIDIDTNGILWTALGGSGHIASFDRSKCKVLNGPTATGQHCPEGWELHPTPGPQMKGVTASGSADFHYYIWVDQFNVLGLGKNVPVANGTTSDSLIAWLPDKKEMVTLRVPYPLGFYTRGLDGRIDDSRAGWKARGLWASTNSGALHHMEGGRDRTGEIMHFQVRPHPLAN
ncbi:MAG: carboxypeptidase regulatory-like domain-containing protein [Deltaproteobacteria bacterium]|nr:carboxypeptidase regulatory-like domain-containing protein [Deltaproteobacteria bacterium]